MDREPLKHISWGKIKLSDASIKQKGKQKIYQPEKKQGGFIDYRAMCTNTEMYSDDSKLTDVVNFVVFCAE